MTSRMQSDRIFEEAAEWLIRLQDPDVPVEDTVAWQAWMKSGPEHAKAFAELAEVSRLARNVRPPREPDADELERDGYDGSVPLDQWQPPSRPRYRQALAASVVLVAIGLVIGFGTDVFEARAGRASLLSTAIGENRAFSLADGSSVVLGGNTRLEVAMSHDTRSIGLLQGEAFFTVAKDPGRPFRVRAGDATVVAVGTEFNVRRVSDHAIVSVVEGRVIVEPHSDLLPVAVLTTFKPRLRPVSVGAGEQTIARPVAIENAARIEDPGATTSWQTGRLSFRLQPLGDVLEDVNRYAPKPIVLGDESIGGLVITGTVTRENVSGWIRSLERGFGLTATEESDRVVLRRQ